MKTRLSILILGLAMCNLSVLRAQHEFTGTILDSAGTAIPGVGISFLNSYKGNYSNAEGAFKIQNLNNGKYAVMVHSIGYNTILDTIEIKDSNLNKNYTVTVRSYVTDEVVITSSRAGNNTPTTYTNISKEEIAKNNFGQDLPFLLNETPSTVVNSDAGTGIGYTGIRIRGVDPTRTNVTVNGIPLNDAESHGVYWVNMPDFASSINSIQIQRGAGTSTNGAAAFGASINIQSNEFNEKAYAELANSFGSFNTWKNTIKVGTGLLNNRFSVDARLSQISSDGYIDRATANLQSYYLAGAYYGDKTTVKANVFGGKEITYQAWWGTPESVFKQDTAGINDFIARNWITGADSANLKNAGRTYNYYTYDNEVDHYQQNHYQLHLVHQFNKKVSGNISGHYTAGQGYYEQYRKEDALSDYGLAPVVIGSDTVTSTNLIRRRWLDNDFYGVVYNLNYKNLKGIEMTFGGGANTYEGTHFGEIIWAQFASNSEIRDRYYDNYANKSEVNNFLKLNLEKGKTNYFVDLQYRYIHYQFEGQTVQNNVTFPITRKVHYNFLNPKVGISHQFNDQHKIYASLSTAKREPVRDDFTQSSANSTPLHEELLNVELGHHFTAKSSFLSTNLYLMDYKNQLVLTGQINDVGAYNRTNIAQSYRAGVEFSGGVLLGKQFKISANASISQNKIPAFTEYIDDYDNGGQIEIKHKDTDIAFSPNLIVGGNISWSPIKSLELALLPKYVGKQYLDNTSNENRSIAAFTTTNFRIQYSFENKTFKNVSIGVLANNIFGELYANNGYTYSYVAGGTITENFYYPQAGRNFLANLVVKF